MGSALGSVWVLCGAGPGSPAGARLARHVRGGLVRRDGHPAPPEPHTHRGLVLCECPPKS